MWGDLGLGLTITLNHFTRHYPARVLNQSPSAEGSDTDHDGGVSTQNWQTMSVKKLTLHNYGKLTIVVHKFFFTLTYITSVARSSEF